MMMPSSEKERVLARLEKGEHVAEIRERDIAQFAALEWRVYIDGSLTESRMYHGERAKDYGIELLARRGVFIEDGWTEVEGRTSGVAPVWN